MWSNDIHLELKGVVRINLEQQQQQHQNQVGDEEEATDQTSIGGFLADGQYAWVAKGSHLDVVCSRSGDKLLSHNFEIDSRTRNCTICNVHGMEQSEAGSYLIAVGIQLYGNAGAVIVMTVQGARILGKIDVNEKISCVQPVSRASYGRGRVSPFNGCIAVGTVSGKVLLIDACLRNETTTLFGQRQVMNRLDKTQCHVEFANVDMVTNHELVRQREVYFGLQLECADEEASPVIALLDLPSLMAISVGYADGRMVLYDLLELRILHVANPPIEDSPVISMNLVEPTNDPKACVYIWTFHAGVEGAFAVLHTLMYEEKYAEPEGHVYERFISCSPRLNVSCYDKGSFPLGVQSIMKTVSQEEEVLTLCVLSWVTSDRSTNILVFDLNQWYKAEMPFACDWRHELNHTVFFSVKDVAMNTRLMVDSLIPFNSIQRPEEHFYPNSLSFDIMTLNNGSCARYHWIGLQNKILEYLEQMGSSAVMNPGKLYHVMLRAALIPQFIDYNYTADTPVDVQREFILSVALEYNCYSLLRECAVSWADGSHLGQEPGEGVSLSTLTNWIWSRAKALKELSNLMCVPLFDLSGRRIDCGTQKTLLHCSRQLKQLAKLYEVILVQCKQYIPEKVFKNLKSQGASIQLAADYQEVVQWLLNVGLLPEGNIDGVNLSDEFLLVPFPYPAIRTYFATQRTMLCDKQPGDDVNSGNVEEQSCKYLFIDNFIEREFKAEALRKVWLENNASGVYPPNSMQNLLRALLIANVSLEAKYVLLCYTFMDMTAVLSDGRYGGIVQNLIKFPAVFKLNSAIIKRTQAFWFLDHGNIESAIEELLSPMSQSEQFPVWQREFLISALLRYDSPHLALRVLRSPGMPISPFLELKTLLENNLISEAFKLQRSKHDTNLLRYFFEETLKSTKYEVLLGLALTDEETRILREYLTKTSQPMADNVHFMHLLQKLDFVEAVHMVEKLGRKRSVEYNLEAPREALTLYHAALEPTTQHLSYLAYAEHKELKPSKAPYAEPLSSRLIRGRADFRSRIYHKSIISIKEAAEPIEHAQPFLEKPGLGMFQFRSQIKSSNVCYPIKLDAKKPKRKLDDDILEGEPKSKASEIFVDYEKPKKRRKLDSDVPYQTSLVAPKCVLTEFRPTKPNFNFTSKTFEASSEKSLSRSPSAQLTTPLVQKRQPYNPPSPESVSSYTPHGILRSTTSVQSFVPRRSVSPVSVSVLRGGGTAGPEEKVLRFDLPESPQVEKSQPSFAIASPPAVVKPVDEPADVSLVSNDEFFSPEGSVVMFGDEDGTSFLSSGPKRRPSIHSHSRSVTPVENNIAIIIEDDNADDDSSSKQQPDECLPDEPMDSVEEDEEEEVDPPVQKAYLFGGRKPLGRLVLEANARKAMEAELESTPETQPPPEEEELEPITEQDVEMVEREEVKEDVIQSDCEPIAAAEEVPTEEVVAPKVTEESKEVVVEEPPEVPEDLGELVVLDKTSSDESSNSTDEEDVDVAESSTADDDDDDGDGLKYGESDLDEVEEDEVQNSEASVEEIIDISSSSEKPEESHAESSDEDSSDDSDGNDSSIAASITVDEGQAEVVVEAAADQDNPTSVANANYADFYSDTVPDVIMEPEGDEPASSEAQVSTTTSSAESNVEGGEEVAQPAPENAPSAERQSPDGASHKHQAQDLTVSQEGAAVEEEHREQTPEPTSSSARDLSVVGNERQDQPMADAEIKLISPSREESFKSKVDEKFLGKPKNAHEVDIPAMNLSVKPDEAHGANRKNSKSDESDDSAALNLSTGQLVEPLRVDEPLSGSEQAEEERAQAAVDPERDDPLEGPSTRLTTKSEHQPPGGEILSKQLVKTSSLDAETPATPRRSRRLSVESGDASTSTPRTNIRTRRMSAMEKIEETDATPSKRMARASSVVPPDTASPPSTPLSKGKRHSSMNNLAPTPDTVALTPRRSTRASSLAKELLTSTPTRRRRLSETFKAETNEAGNASPSKANDSFSTQGDARSEVSNVSVSSRRSLRRKPASVQPAISEEEVPANPSFQEESFAEYTTKRRLTRHQSSVIEKSLEIARKIGTIAEAAENVSTPEQQDQADQDSESESVTSNVSNNSKRSRASQPMASKGKAASTAGRGKAKPPVAGRARSTRSTASSSRKEGGSDAESVETESPTKKLEPISEEADEPASKVKRRGRPKKSN
uniref:Putative nuclear pore complex assembly n=1 Tax=Culex tarsalis TaxID=7177 RepID=A0A1Q3F0S0_CULTA